MVATDITADPMAKTTDAPESEDFRRVPILLTPAERHRLRLFALQHNDTMERLAGRWVVEKLEQEEAKAQHRKR